MHIIYVLPKQNYFTQGRRGRVAHAIGVAGGLSANGARVTVLSGPGTEKAMKDCGVRCIEVDDVETGFLNHWRWTSNAIDVLNQEMNNTDVDAVVVRYAVSTAFRYARVFKRATGCLTCFEVNSLAYHQYHRLPNVVRRIFLAIENSILKHADVNNAVSSTLALDLNKGNREKPKVVVIPNAATRRDIQPLEQPSDNSEVAAVTRFIYMGVFQPYYELDLVVKSFLHLTELGVDAELDLYGDGGQFDTIESLAKDHDKITLHGRYNLDNLLDSGVLNGNVVLLLPNRGSGMSEIGSPIKFYEYMSFGRAILASKVGQAYELLENEQTCLFYEPGNEESCTAAMKRLASDRALRHTLATNVLTNFTAKHTWEARMGEFLGELQQTVADVTNV